MSKAIGRGLSAFSTFGASELLGGNSKNKAAQYDGTPTQSLVNYLNNYDATNADTTLENLTKWASESSSNNLNNMGDYTFGVEASDEARQRAENSVYNAMVDKMTPQFDRQRENMATMLQNQGIPVGSEAYSRAMGDLEDKQNEALQQAAYQSVLGGQDAYSQSLADAISAGSFGNTAQQSYIQQLQNALNGSLSSYDVAMDKYAAQNNLAAQNYAAKQQAINNQNAQTNSLIQGASSIGSAALMAALMSDKRLKENIKPVGKLDNGLTVYCFNYKGDNVPQIGLIAQEVQEVKPEAVIETEDGYLAVKYDLATEK